MLGVFCQRVDFGVALDNNNVNHLFIKFMLAIRLKGAFARFPSLLDQANFPSTLLLAIAVLIRDTPAYANKCNSKLLAVSSKSGGGGRREGGGGGCSSSYASNNGIKQVTNSPRQAAVLWVHLEKKPPCIRKRNK